MNLVDMAIKPAAANKMYAECAVPSCNPYPYGLRINLNQEQMDALGIKDLPVAGTTMHLEAVAVVTRSSTEDPDADGDVDYVCLEMQVTQLAVEEGEAGEGDDEDEDEGNGASKDDRAERMYGKGKQPA
jgi:hypothetical protein